jgi:hypothetical protein
VCLYVQVTLLLHDLQEGMNKLVRPPEVSLQKGHIVHAQTYT